MKQISAKHDADYETKAPSAVFMELWMDTPLGVPKQDLERAHAANDPEVLLDVPGVHLKSIERSTSSSFPRYFGKLASYSEEEVVVLSKIGSDGHPCIWRGTPAEHRAMWVVD
jgi:hypothetical protein